MEDNSADVLKDFISIPEAIEIAKSYGINLSSPTAISWCRKFGLGHQPGKDKYARWAVNRIKWMNFILGTSKGTVSWCRQRLVRK